MKKFLLMLLPIAALVTGCRYDDSDVWDELNNHETRLLALEQKVNTDLATLQAAIEALNNKVYVSSVTSTSNGFTVTFTNGNSYTISNGESSTPVISVKEDTDGVYYWTVDGEWLLDGDGNKVCAEAVAPQVKIEDDKWYVSTDGGTTWTEAGPAVGEGIFKNVAQEEGYLLLTLQDDTVIAVPMAELMKKLQLVFDESQIQSIPAGATAEVTYQVVVPEGETFEFETFENNGYTVTVTPADAEGLSGTIAVTAPSPAVKGKVLFILTGSKGSSFVKSVTVNGDPSISADKTEYAIDSRAGSFEIAVTANVPYTSEIEAGITWLTKGAAENQFTVEANTSTTDNRSATVTFTAEGLQPVVVTVTQNAIEAIVLTSSQAEVEDEAGTLEVVVNTNTPLSVETDVDWIEYTGTKAMSEKVLQFNIEENTTASAREGKISISAGDVVQVVTVTQVAAGDAVLKAATVKDFLAAEVSTEVWYKLTGRISNLKNTTYGNFDLVDETGSVYVYGLTATKVGSNDKSFASLGLKEGDVLTLAATRTAFNDVAQAGGPAYYVSHITAATITVTSTSAQVETSKTYEIGATTDGGALSYASDNTNVATVDSKGVITGVAEGTATITITAAATETLASNSIKIKVTVVPAGSGAATVLWSETWTGGAANETPVSYGKEGTTVYGDGTVTYSITSGDSNTKLYNDNQMNGSTVQLNLLLGKSGKTWTISGIPTGGAKNATLKFYVNNGNTANNSSFTVTSSTEGITLGEKTQGDETAKPFSFTYSISIGAEVETFDITFTNGVGSNIRLDDLSVEAFLAE